MRIIKRIYSVVEFNKPMAGDLVVRNKDGKDQAETNEDIKLVAETE